MRADRARKISVAFILGVLPLAVARGAGAEMRQALGIAVLGGMIGVTVFGVFLTPVFFAVVDRLTHTRLFTHPWVVAASRGTMYVVALKFVRPLAALAASKAAAGVRKVSRNRYGA